MPDYWKIFPRRHVFLPVIHAQNPAQALENAEIAYEEGADGIFLIDHKIPTGELVKCYMSVRNAFPYWWIGLNFLHETILQSIALVNTVSSFASNPYPSGLWVDDAKIREEDDDAAATEIPRLVLEKMLEKGASWRSLYFAGIAFKYQEPVRDLGRVARLAVPYVDVITTSGEETGVPPALEKMNTIRQAVGPDVPVAIASGITETNVGRYKNTANAFLVATSICNDWHHLDRARVRALRKAIDAP